MRINRNCRECLYVQNISDMAMGDGGEEEGMPSKPDTVTVSDWPIRPEPVIGSSKQNVVEKKKRKQRKKLEGEDEFYDFLRLAWNSIIVLGWIPIVMMLFFDVGEECFYTYVCMFMLWYPVKRQGASLSVEQLR